MILYIITISLKTFSDIRNKYILLNIFDKNNYLKFTVILFNFFSMIFMIYTPEFIKISINSKKNNLNLIDKNKNNYNNYIIIIIIIFNLIFLFLFLFLFLFFR